MPGIGGGGYSTEAKAKAKRRKRRTGFLAQLVGDGLFEIAGFADFARFMRRRYRIGDQFIVEVRKARNPYFHRLVMGLIHKLAENRDEFNGDTEKALYVLKVKLGRATIFALDENTTGWIPESIAFENMDEGEFRIFFDDLCHLLANDYWPDMTREQVRAMAEILAGRNRE